jgi:NAD(P)-dependent dehydrogenase (short-subunit alcohol dehydrogenase family)
MSEVTTLRQIRRGHPGTRRGSSFICCIAGSGLERGQLDVMFANAGRSMTPRSEGGGSLALEDVTQSQWDDVTNVSFRGVFFSGKYACHAMKKQGFGNIVVTVSAAAANSYPGIAVYGAGKAGLLGLIRGMATDWGKYGIRVNGLAPTHGDVRQLRSSAHGPRRRPLLRGVRHPEFGAGVESEAIVSRAAEGAAPP